MGFKSVRSNLHYHNSVRSCVAQSLLNISLERLAVQRYRYITSRQF